jgi:hypothetical protein
VHRTRRQLGQELGKAGFVEPLDISADRLGPLTLRQEGDRPGSVARDHCEHAVVVALADAEEAGQLMSRLALGEQAAEERGRRRGSKRPSSGIDCDSGGISSATHSAA